VPTCYRHPDRETGLSCSDCGRPICTDCATFAPVGIRCPEHSGRPQGVARVATGARRVSFGGTGALLTKALIAVNVLVFLIQLGQGATLGNTSGPLFERGALLIGPAASHGKLVGLAEGEWWRLITSAFLHASILHLAINMLVLWIFGSALEQVLGRARFILIYLVSGLAGSAGALLLSPNAVTVGASGAVFGLFGAAFVLERQAGITNGPAFTVIVLNLAFSFLIPGVSIGGHLGGLVGGAASTLALSRFGRGHAVYGRLGLLGIASILAVGVLSVAVAFVQVNRFS
jgi:membrane associated rhomboid family serine protease